MNFTFTATIILTLPMTSSRSKERDSIRQTEKRNPGEQGLLLIITCPLKVGLGSTLVFADKDPVFSRDFNLSKRSSDIFVRRA